MIILKWVFRCVHSECFIMSYKPEVAESLLYVILLSEWLTNIQEYDEVLSQRNVITFIIHITLLQIEIGYCIMLQGRVMINF